MKSVEMDFQAQGGSCWAAVLVGSITYVYLKCRVRGIFFFFSFVLIQPALMLKSFITSP